jgi:hypothetical protein
MNKLIASRSAVNWLKVTPVIVLCVAVGVLVVLAGRAAGDFVAFEAEIGVKSGDVAAVSLAGASGSQVIKFGQNIMPAPSPTVNPVAELPKQGISTGYKILTRSAADRQFELDKITRVFSGHAGYVRVDSTPSNQLQLDALMPDILSRGLVPMLVLYGTTDPIAANSFGHDQAVKWAGKVRYFEIANEPDLHGWTPDGYADFVKATSQSIKSGNTNAVVIAGALWKGNTYTTQDYVRSLAIRAGGSFQMLSLHLYDDPKSRGSWNIWDMAFPVLFGVNSIFKGNTCREILNANNLSSMPIIATESGGPIGTYGEAGQSNIIANDFDAMNANLLPSMAIYTMKNDDVAGFGLLRDDNSERPAFATFMNRAY